VGIPDPRALRSIGAPSCIAIMDIECYVKLMGTNLTGYLVDDPGKMGIGGVTFRLV